MNTLHDKRPKFKRLTSKAKREILDALRAEISVIELSGKYGVTRKTIYDLAKKERAADSLSAAPTVLTVRLDIEDLRALDALASDLGLTRAEAARRVLRRASGFLDMEIEDRNAILSVAKQLKGMGVNLNQLVAHANRKALMTGKGLISESDLREIAQMRDDIAHFLDRVVGSIRNIAKFRRQKVADLLREIGE